MLARIFDGKCAKNFAAPELVDFGAGGIGPSTNFRWEPFTG